MYDQVSFYLLGLASLLIGFILAFSSILMIVSILGEFRKGKPYDNKFNHDFAKSLLRLALHIARIKVTVTGMENMPKDNKFVFVSNHQENYDIMILLPTFKDHPICFIAKEPLFKAPIIGKWIGLLGNVPIGREADREAAMSIITGIKRYKAGVPFGIFPEGKRSFSNEMIEFKPGALKLAMKPKADILIGTLYDGPVIFKRFPWKRYDIRVHIHPLLKYEDYKDLNSHELSDKIKAVIQEKIDEFNEMKKNKK
jgi:1-acyl-sn-glycerol-3-phosphate acyltransferase